jgi:hypothetical protein
LPLWQAAFQDSPTAVGSTYAPHGGRRSAAGSLTLFAALTSVMRRFVWQA